MRTLVLTAALALAFGQPAIAQTAMEKMRKADQQKAASKNPQRKASALEKKGRAICDRQANEKKLRGNERRRFMDNCGKG